jgi:hypothetical protein
MTEPYAHAAELFLGLALKTWESEEVMDKVFQGLHRGPKFDRTTHGRAVTNALFDVAWAAASGSSVVKPVLQDKAKVLAELLKLVPEDFNLFTQLAPNLMDCPLQVRSGDLQAEFKKLETEFQLQTELPNPFIDKKKAKVTAATHNPEQVRRYAYAVSLLRAWGILTTSEFSGLSHRITPHGKTPAFSDSASFCQLPALGDAYLLPSSTLTRLGFLSWGAQPVDLLPMVILEDGSIEVSGLPEGFRYFKSESGGSMLQYALVARQTAFTVWNLWAAMGAPPAVSIIPRVNSIQVLGPGGFLETVKAMTATTPWLIWSWDKRPEILKEDNAV